MVLHLIHDSGARMFSVILWDYVNRGQPVLCDHSVSFAGLDTVTLENANNVAPLVD